MGALPKEFSSMVVNHVYLGIALLLAILFPASKMGGQPGVQGDIVVHECNMASEV